MGRQPPFSEREKQVIELLVQGKSNKQIALALGVSLRTVEYHLSNIYAKLGVTSRTEAALKLSKTDLRESAGEALRESTVFETDESGDNRETPASRWRIPVSKSFLIGLGILILTSIFCYGSLYSMVKDRAATHDAELVGSNPTSIPTSTLAAQTKTSAPAISAKEHILEQVRQLAAEYEQAVQAEKQHGNVEYGKDPTTGEDTFFFQGESSDRIIELSVKLNDQIFQLYKLYSEVYRDEIQPTPFPTPSSPEQREIYLQFLYEQAEVFCPTQELDLNDATVMIYDPGDGKYHPWIINDEVARCEVYGQMIEEWRTAPLLAQVNKEADMALIRQIMGEPGLNLTFQSVIGVPNAPWRSTALYTDETGSSYYLDIKTSRLAAIEPHIPGHPDIPDTEQKSIDELRGVARQFAATNSPRLAELEAVLLYEENCKGEICFFRWDYRNKDWSGTDWVMMPPFLQVGVLANGEIVAYINTIDLFE